MLKYTNTKVIDSFDWDKLVQETYGKPYCFQQQDDCQPRGTHSITIPEGDIEDYDFENEKIPFKINGNIMGVKFNTWLNTSEEDIKKEFPERESSLHLFWDRNFYPSLQVLANDLHSKGLIETGKYVINIDW